MKIVKASACIEGEIDGAEILKKIELNGRTCYKSEGKITAESKYKFAKKIVKRAEESVLEHASVTVRIICDRGVSHEIVRHRLSSFSQESTRYCDYSGGEGVIFVDPINLSGQDYTIWKNLMCLAENAYLALRQNGVSAQMARSVLPHSLKTELVVTTNLREWRHIFRQRTSAKAHPQMREIMIPLLCEFKEKIPVVFDDIEFSHYASAGEKKK